MPLSSYLTACIFNACYPCELSLQYELQALAPHFTRILLFPTSLREFEPNSLPPNATVIEALLPEAGTRAPVSFRGLTEGAVAYASETLSSSGLAYLRSPKRYLSILWREVTKAALLEKLIRSYGLSDALFYDYWFENSLLALCLLKSRGHVRHLVSRAHGFDVYDERWARGVVPFRRFKLSHLDRLFVVSEIGRAYTNNRVSERLRSKVAVSRLGVPEPTQLGPSRRHSGRFGLVSVSSTQPFKRVHLIPDILGSVGLPLEWHHFGDGPMTEVMLSRARSLPENVSWTFHGAVGYSQIKRHYETQQVDLFLSLSETEGIPVSMMEAISYGIPILACRAGGVPEIVTETTGVLVDIAASPGEVASLMRHLLSRYPFEPTAIRQFFKTHYCADVNYGQFADELRAVLQPDPSKC